MSLPPTDTVHTGPPDAVHTGPPDYVDSSSSVYRILRGLVLVYPKDTRKELYTSRNGIVLNTLKEAADFVKGYTEIKEYKSKLDTTTEIKLEPLDCPGYLDRYKDLESKTVLLNNLLECFDLETTKTTTETTTVKQLFLDSDAFPFSLMLISFAKKIQPLSATVLAKINCVYLYGQYDFTWFETWMVQIVNNKQLLKQYLDNYRSLCVYYPDAETFYVIVGLEPTAPEFTIIPFDFHIKPHKDPEFIAHF